ncbi:TetR/AcrR family transcriptional regulator [Cystobacter fuscus]|uniref:TetR/AcrR family transcriptional regulator n=1 Tax=Cystobacter fuscus TaxID=43 RepID=UPI002B2CD0E5|nr:TetR/AcrR family transcriptional regulator [Cystobacter fuscus]
MNATTADRILDAAQAIMMERGYSGFSYADIAEVVKISKPTIHHHFPSKAMLARDVVVRYRENIRLSFTHLGQMVPDPLGQLKAYVSYWETCIREKTTPFCVCALLAAEMPTLPEEVGAEVRDHFRELAGWLAKTLEEGRRRGSLAFGRTAALEAELFMATIHGAMLAARASGEWMVFSSVTTEALRLLQTRT